MTVPAAATRLTPVSATADARGLAAASTAFVIWGVLPLYLKQLESVKKSGVKSRRDCGCNAAMASVRTPAPLNPLQDVVRGWQAPPTF